MVCNIYAGEVINHQVEYRTPPIAPSYIVTNNNGTSTTLGGAGSWTNVPPIFDTNNVCMAGILTTNYTINIPTTWSVDDIRKAVAAVAPKMSGTNSSLTLDWADGIHNYYATGIYISALLEGVNYPKQRLGANIAFTTNAPIRLVGNPENPSACVLRFGVPTENTAIRGDGEFCSINGFTIMSTNATRPSAWAFYGGPNCLAGLYNIVASNWANGLGVIFGGTITTTNCKVINCSNGFLAREAGQIFASGNMYATNCSYGFVAHYNGVIDFYGAVTRADCCDVAYSSQNSSYIYAPSTFAVSNAVGYQCVNGGIIEAASSYTSNSITYCYASGYQCTLRAASSTAYPVGTALGYYAVNGGMIDAASVTTPETVYAALPYFDSIAPDGSVVKRYGGGTTISIGGIDNVTKLSALIEGFGKNLNGNTYQLYLTGNTFTSTVPIAISNHYCGRIYIFGSNYTSYANATNQITIFDGRASAPVSGDPIFNIIENRGYVMIRGMKFYSFNLANSAGIRFSTGSINGDARECSFVGTNTTANYGVYANSMSGRFYLRTSVGMSLNSFVYSQISDIVVLDCNTTNTAPLVNNSFYADQGGRIHITNANTNYPAVTILTATSGGMIVTNAGRVIP